MRFSPLFAAAAVLVLAGCAATASSPPERAIPENLTGTQLCDVARSTLAPAVLPGVNLGQADPTDRLTDHECSLAAADSSKQRVGLIVIYGKGSLSQTETINKAMTDGSSNSKEQCPGGASVPAVSSGLPAETTLICNRTLTSLVNYTGLSDVGTLIITVDRAISKGKITAADVQNWVTAVAARLLVSTTATAAATGAETLEQISGKWSGPTIPSGFELSGPQKTIKTIRSQRAVFASLGDDPCQVVTTGAPIQSSDEASDSSFEFLQTLSSTGDGPHAVLSITDRAFDSNQDAKNWVASLNAMVDPCKSKENIGPGFFTENSSSLIRWSGIAVHNQQFAGFILVAGNAVFYGSAIGQTDAASHSWLTEAEQSCRDSVR